MLFAIAPVSLLCVDGKPAQPAHKRTSTHKPRFALFYDVGRTLNDQAWQRAAIGNTGKSSAGGGASSATPPAQVPTVRMRCSPTSCDTCRNTSSSKADMSVSAEPSGPLRRPAPVLRCAATCSKQRGGFAPGIIVWPRGQSLAALLKALCCWAGMNSGRLTGSGGSGVSPAFGRGVDSDDMTVMRNGGDLDLGGKWQLGNSCSRPSMVVAGLQRMGTRQTPLFVVELNLTTATSARKCLCEKS